MERKCREKPGFWNITSLDAVFDLTYLCRNGLGIRLRMCTGHFRFHQQNRFLHSYKAVAVGKLNGENLKCSKLAHFV